MNITSAISLWLIRLYAVVLAVVTFGNILEGAAYKLILILLVLLIILQSFFVSPKKS